MKALKPKWFVALQCLPLSPPCFSLLLNMQASFCFLGFWAFALAPPPIWETLSPDLLGSPSLSASEKEVLLRDSFQDYPILKKLASHSLILLYLFYCIFPIAHIPNFMHYMHIYLSIFPPNYKPHSQTLFCFVYFDRPRIWTNVCYVVDAYRSLFNKGVN